MPFLFRDTLCLSPLVAWLLGCLIGCLIEEAVILHTHTQAHRDAELQNTSMSLKKLASSLPKSGWDKLSAAISASSSSDVSSSGERAPSPRSTTTKRKKKRRWLTSITPDVFFIALLTPSHFHLSLSLNQSHTDSIAHTLSQSHTHPLNCTHSLSFSFSFLLFFEPCLLSGILPVLTQEVRSGKNKVCCAI